MDAPFNYVNGEKIDLQNPKHRDEVINRNKKLQSAIENGIGLDDFIKITIDTNLETTCLKCGHEIVKHFRLKLDYAEDLELRIPNFICPCCESYYTYSQEKEVYKVSVPKPKLPPPAKN